MVLAGIGTGMIALAHIDEAVVQIKVTPVQVADHRAAMPGNIGQLAFISATVAVVSGVGVVLSLLVGITQVDVQNHISGQVQRGAGTHVDAADFHYSHIHHHPAVLACPLGYGDNLVGDIVVVGISAQLDTGEQAAVGKQTVEEAHIILGGILGIERDVAHVGIIQVVERGHAEDALVIGPQVEFPILPGLPAEEDGRRDLVHVLTHLTHNLAVETRRRAVVDHRVEQAALRLETVPRPCGRQGGEYRVANGIAKARQRSIQAVPLVIYRQVHVPIGNNGVFIGRGEVNLVLPELVVDVHQSRVRVEVMQVITRVLGIEHHLITVGKLALIGPLQEEIAVPLLLGMFPHIVDDSAGNALAAVIPVGLGMPLATGHDTEDRAFNAIGAHFTVLTHGGSVPSQGAVAVVAHVAEAVLTCGIGELAVERQAHRTAQLVLPAHAGIDEPEGSRLERHVEVVTLAVLELGTARAQVDGACRAIVLSTLENVTALTVIERNGLDVVEREFAQINLAVLGIPDLDAVIKHTHVVGAHRADVDRLEAAHTAIVLELNTSKVTHGIGHRMAVQAFQLLAREFLGGNYVFIGSAPIDDDILDILHRVQPPVAHCSHHRVGLVCKHTFLGIDAQDTQDGQT